MPLFLPRMSFLVKLGLILSLFASWASCFTKFVRPPERDEDQAADQDLTKNNQYYDGQNILIIFDTNIRKVDLYIRQVIDAIDSEKSTEALLKSNGNSKSEKWKAQYDISNVMENNEDCIYWFELRDRESNGTLAESQYVNVSAPKSDETKTTAAAPASPNLNMETATSTTDTSPSIEASSTSEPSSKSGFSKGEIAGVAVGATIGGLLILGGIGWIVWRRRVRRKNDAVLAELPGDHNQDQPYSERPKSELPAEPIVFPLQRPGSPSRIYEAP